MIFPSEIHHNDIVLAENNFDDQGYYICNGQKFYNKVEAILHAQKHNLNFDIKFYFNDAVYDQYQWDQEPIETLDQLYAQRARELREKYDYLVVHFSGGYDSGNILETFAKNNILIDEIFIRGPIASSKKNILDNSAKNFYAEIFFQSIPLAEYAKNTYWPNVKITVRDTVSYTLDYWAKNKFWADDQYIDFFSPGCVYKSDYDELNPEFKNLAESGKKIAHIIGMEKPDIYYENGRYFIRFLDKFSSIQTPRSRRENQFPIYREPFYWAPSTAKMIIKQGHVVKRHLKKYHLNPIACLTGQSRHEFLGSIIYNRTWPILFTQIKPSQEIQEYDYYFFKDMESDHYVNWRNGMDYLQTKINPSWMHDGNIDKGLLGIYSKYYDIGT